MMSFTFVPTDIPEVIKIAPEVFGDERWFFMESYHRDAFLRWGIAATFIQDNHSKSKKGVFRGFHFQTQQAQSKLVRVVVWSVLDFAIDVRMGSRTFGHYVMVELSAQNKQQLFIPQGFAHGFLVLEDDTELLYKCDDIYAPQYDSGIIYNDPTLQIDRDATMTNYNISHLIISDKDKKNKTLEQYRQDPAFFMN